MLMVVNYPSDRRERHPSPGSGANVPRERRTWAHFAHYVCLHEVFEARA